MKHSRSHQRIRNIRRANISATYATLRECGEAISLASLCSRTGLSRATLTHVLRALESKNRIVTVQGATDSLSGGRPPTLYGLNEQHHTNLFLRLTLGAVHGSLVDAAGRILDNREVQYETYGEAGAALRELATQLRNAVPKHAPLERTVIAMVGIVRDGVVVRSRNFPDLEGDGLRTLLSDVTGTEIVVANDAKLAAKASYHSVKDDFSSNLMIGLHISEAIGCAVVIDGTILEGAHGAAGELGSDREGGWPEAEALLKETCRRRDISIRQLFSLAGEGDQEARQTTYQAMLLICRALVPLILGFDPDIIVVAGAIIDAEPVVLEALHDVLDEIVPYPPTVVVARQGRSYVTVGALQMMFDEDVRALADQIVAE